jgi:hypothetical protein
MLRLQESLPELGTVGGEDQLLGRRSKGVGTAFDQPLIPELADHDGRVRRLAAIRLASSPMVIGPVSSRSAVAPTTPQLRDHLHRFAFLLDGNDGEPLFQPAQPEPGTPTPPNAPSPWPRPRADRPVTARLRWHPADPDHRAERKPL